jgi:putative endonuclease
MGFESYRQGIEGEEIARAFLTQQNYEILENNFHSSQGEIDLIARDHDCLVFVEVKNYSFRSYGSPLSAVGRTKKKSIIHAAEYYLYKNNIRNIFSRFDVITVYRRANGERVIEHYKDAFYVN